MICAQGLSAAQHDIEGTRPVKLWGLAPWRISSPLLFGRDRPSWSRERQVASGALGFDSHRLLIVCPARHTLDALLQSLLFSRLLRSAATFKRAVVFAVSYVFGFEDARSHKVPVDDRLVVINSQTEVSARVQESFDQGDIPAPSPATLSRARFLVAWRP